MKREPVPILLARAQDCFLFAMDLLPGDHPIDRSEDPIRLKHPCILALQREGRDSQAESVIALLQLACYFCNVALDDPEITRLDVVSARLMILKCNGVLKGPCPRLHDSALLHTVSEELDALDGEFMQMGDDDAVPYYTYRGTCEALTLLLKRDVDGFSEKVFELATRVHDDTPLFLYWLGLLDPHAVTWLLDLMRSDGHWDLFPTALMHPFLPGGVFGPSAE